MAAAAVATSPAASAIEQDSLSTKASIIGCGFADQMRTTGLAMLNHGVHLRRKTWLYYLNARDMYKSVKEPTQKGAKKNPLLDALADISPLNECYEEDIIHAQENYFTIVLLMMALSIGGILGNLWTEFTWAPQLGVLQALLVIALLPLKYWLGVNGAPDVGTVYGMRKITIRERRAELCLALFAMGFSMGNLCKYSLLITAPRIFCPLTFALMINTTGTKHVTSPSASARSKSQPLSPSSSSSIHRGVIGTRLELFLRVGAIVFVGCFFMLFLSGDLSLWTFTLFVPVMAFNLQLLVIHFQLLYYAIYTLRERWQNDTMKEEKPKNDGHDAAHGHGHGAAATTSTRQWSLESVDRWLMNADLTYAMVSLALDVVCGVLQSFC